MIHEHEIYSRTFRPPLKQYEDGQPWRYAHWKRDGHYLRIEVDSRENPVKWSAFTRRPTAVGYALRDCWKGLLGLLDGLRATPGSWIILAEMYYPGQPASYVKTGLATGDTGLSVEAFALLKIPKYEILETAAMNLQDVSFLCRHHGIPFVPFYEGPIRDADTPSMMYSAHNELMPNDAIEGFVLKTSNLNGWRKWKHTKTIDLICAGYVEGTGKYKGLIGSVQGAVCNSNGERVIIADCSGMTDAQRSFISRHRSEHLDKVFEVEYQLVGSQGRLRHPVFKGWRDDKQPWQCSVSQDPELEKAWSV
jgi:hypothetical protein